MRLTILRTFLGVALVAAAAACSGQKPATAAAPPPDAKRVDDSKTGALAGRVLIEGPVPANVPIKMLTDPYCLRAHPDGSSFESYVVENGGLENVFVYVKDGLGNYVYDTPTTPAVLDQKGCRYTPHVFGVRVNQPVEIVNSDPTLHNIHALPKANQEFNNGQPIQGMKMTHTFTAKEVMVPFKCDVHGWMNAYVGVLDHPYFAVTGNDGTYSLASLPAGTYTIEAWHEKLGATTQSVTIGPKETKEVTFSFKI